MKILDKKRIFLFIIDVILIGTMFVSANAMLTGKPITAYYGDIKLVVNGNRVTPKNSDGKIVEPFIVDGSVYLPVRAVAEALSQSVSWDGNTNTVNIGANRDISQPNTWLYSLNAVSGNFNSDTASPITDNFGNSYNNYLVPNSKSLNFALNGQYSRFDGKLVLLNKYKNTTKNHFIEIYVDDKLVHTTKYVKKDSPAVDFSVDIRNALKMTIVWRANNIYGDFSGRFSDETALAKPALWK